MLNGICNIKNQYFPPAPALTSVPPGSQIGRVFIVTGGNQGLGLELLKLLYPSGATIYLTSRSKEKAEEAIKAIRDNHAKTGSAQTSAQTSTLRFLQLDLMDLESVKSAAETFAKQENRLDVLWNNAGSGPFKIPRGTRTKQGLEPFMGMHIAAILLFSELLVPQLRAAASMPSSSPGSTRVLWATSAMAETHTGKNGVDMRKLETGSGGKSPEADYAASKAATWMVAREFARRHAGDGVVSAFFNPGNLRTESWGGVARPVRAVFDTLLLHDPVYGAYTELWAGLAPGVGNGDFLLPWGRAMSNDKIYRKDIVKAAEAQEDGGLGYGAKLWEWAEGKWKAAGVI